jgi:hypothetical protein
MGMKLHDAVKSGGSLFVFVCPDQRVALVGERGPAPHEAGLSGLKP